MARRRKRYQDAERLQLMYEAADHLRMREMRIRLGGPETEGTKALYAAIVAELTPAELAIVRRVATGDEQAHVLHALLPPRRDDGERNTYYFQEKAGVVSGAGGWVFRDSDKTVSLEERRRQKSDAIQ